jgi:hypothetical protein
MRACRRSQSRAQRDNKGSDSGFERWNNEAAAEFGAARPSPISKDADLPRAAIRCDNKRHWALLDAAARFAAE